MTFRVRYSINPDSPHVYCRVFVASGGGTFANTGTLTMRREEFEAFRMMFKGCEFVPEREP